MPIGGVNNNLIPIQRSIYSNTAPAQNVTIVPRTDGDGLDIETVIEEANESSRPQFQNASSVKVLQAPDETLGTIIDVWA